MCENQTTFQGRMHHTFFTNDTRTLKSQHCHQDRVPWSWHTIEMAPLGHTWSGANLVDLVYGWKTRWFPGYVGFVWPLSAQLSFRITQSLKLQVSATKLDRTTEGEDVMLLTEVSGILELSNVWVVVQLILRPMRTKNQLYKNPNSA